MVAQLIEVRSVAVTDLEAANVLWNEFYRYHLALGHDELPPGAATHDYGSEDLQKMIAGDGNLLLLGLIDGRPAGLLRGGIAQKMRKLADGSVERGAKRGFIFDLIVTESLRRRGVGRALINHARSWALERGATSLELGVSANSASAIKFYAREGFVTSQLLLTLKF
jgi:GNAT superfamily N-acetyltransferase